MGQLGQLLQLFERQRNDNRDKAELARCLGHAMASAGPPIDPELLRAELFLLQPTWLSAATSSFHLARLQNMTCGSGIPNLRYRLECKAAFSDIGNVPP